MHEHPTQALLDAFTIRERKKQLKGLKVAIIGDLLHSRVLRSNIQLLTKMGAHVWVWTADADPHRHPEVRRHRDEQCGRSCHGCRRCDVVANSARTDGRRLLPVTREYFRVFGMTELRLQRAKPDVMIMHPGPMNRGVEIASEVADGRIRSSSTRWRMAWRCGWRCCICWRADPNMKTLLKGRR